MAKALDKGRETLDRKINKNINKLLDNNNPLKKKSKGKKKMR